METTGESELKVTSIQPVLESLHEVRDLSVMLHLRAEEVAGELVGVKPETEVPKYPPSEGIPDGIFGDIYNQLQLVQRNIKWALDLLNRL